MRLRIGILALTVLSTWQIPVQADLTFTATGGTVTAGGSTLDIPIYVRSDGSDSLGQFTVVFNIKSDASNLISPVASLGFVKPGSIASDPTLNDMYYVYNPNNPNLSGTASFKQDTGQIFGTASDPNSIGYNTRFAGSDIYDGTDPSGGAMLSPGMDYVIADLILTFTSSTTTNAAGDLFDITFSLTSSSFQDGGGNDLTVASPSMNDTTIAQVLVTPNVVPEPSTLITTLMGVATCVLVNHAVRVHGPGWLKIKGQ
jgi:hypothetical protein